MARTPDPRVKSPAKKAARGRPRKPVDAKAKDGPAGDEGTPKSPEELLAEAKERMANAVAKGKYHKQETASLLEDNTAWHDKLFRRFREEVVKKGKYSPRFRIIGKMKLTCAYATARHRKVLENQKIEDSHAEAVQGFRKGAEIAEEELASATTQEIAALDSVVEGLHRGTADFVKMPSANVNVILKTAGFCGNVDVTAAKAASAELRTQETTPDKNMALLRRKIQEIQKRHAGSSSKPRVPTRERSSRAAQRRPTTFAGVPNSNQGIVAAPSTPGTPEPVFAAAPGSPEPPRHQRPQAKAKPRGQRPAFHGRSIAAANARAPSSRPSQSSDPPWAARGISQFNGEWTVHCEGAVFSVKVTDNGGIIAGDENYKENFVIIEIDQGTRFAIPLKTEVWELYSQTSADEVVWLGKGCGYLSRWTRVVEESRPGARAKSKARAKRQASPSGLPPAARPPHSLGKQQPPRPIPREPVTSHTSQASEPDILSDVSEYQEPPRRVIQTDYTLGCDPNPRPTVEEVFANDTMSKTQLEEALANIDFATAEPYTKTDFEQADGNF